MHRIASLKKIQLIKALLGDGARTWKKMSGGVQETRARGSYRKHPTATACRGGVNASLLGSKLQTWTLARSGLGNYHLYTPISRAHL
jgi:hypothetical protein